MSDQALPLVWGLSAPGADGARSTLHGGGEAAVRVVELGPILELLETAIDMAAYVPQYFMDKHGYLDVVFRMQAFVAQQRRQLVRGEQA